MATEATVYGPPLGKDWFRARSREIATWLSWTDGTWDFRQIKGVGGEASWATEANVNTGDMTTITTPAKSGVVANMTTGTTASSRCRWLSSTAIMSALTLSATTKFAILCRGRLTSTPDANTYLGFGVALDGGAFTQQATFGVKGSSSTTAWHVGTDAANGTGGTIDTSWHNFVMLCDGVSLLKLYVDQVLTASCASAGIDTSGYRVDNYLENGATAAAQVFQFTDYYTFFQV